MRTHNYYFKLGKFSVTVDSPQPLGGAGADTAVTEVVSEDESSKQSTASGATYASAVKGDEKAAQP